jgi:hypothetical protein
MRNTSTRAPSLVIGEKRAVRGPDKNKTRFHGIITLWVPAMSGKNNKN